jgi:hypothetical protein
LAALLVGAALTLSGCGGAGPSNTPAPAPLTFSVTTTTPTSTVATPTAKAYIGPNGFPVETGAFLAPSTTTRLGAIINGIQCEPIAQLAYKTYAHVQVYVHGRSRALPGGIGIVDQAVIETPHGLYYSTNTCMYWLHTRAADGLIEVESPVPRQFTLGDFFAIWNQPLTATHVARFRGKVTATVNGRLWHGDPASIPLTQNAAIQLSVGKPTPAPQPVDWLGTNF